MLSHVINLLLWSISVLPVYILLASTRALWYFHFLYNIYDSSNHLAWIFTFYLLEKNCCFPHYQALLRWSSEVSLLCLMELSTWSIRFSFTSNELDYLSSICTEKPNRNLLLSLNTRNFAVEWEHGLHGCYIMFPNHVKMVFSCKPMFSLFYDPINMDTFLGKIKISEWVGLLVSGWE